jgi:hypothetical protein
LHLDRGAFEACNHDLALRGALEAVTCLENVIDGVSGLGDVEATGNAGKRDRGPGRLEAEHLVGMQNQPDSLPRIVLEFHDTIVLKP